MIDILNVRWFVKQRLCAWMFYRRLSLSLMVFIPRYVSLKVCTYSSHWLHIVLDTPENDVKFCPRTVDGKLINQWHFSCYCSFVNLCHAPWRTQWCYRPLGWLRRGSGEESEWLIDEQWVAESVTFRTSAAGRLAVDAASSALMDS